LYSKQNEQQRNGGQALSLRSELTNSDLRKQRWGTFLHYGVILKIVILHDAIKTIQSDWWGGRNPALWGAAKCFRHL